MLATLTAMCCRSYAFAILLRMKALLVALPTVVDVPVPEGSHITVCGDVHGQFYDLLNIFELNGLPSEDHPYLFNGAHSRCGHSASMRAQKVHSRACASPAPQATLLTAARSLWRSSLR